MSRESTVTATRRPWGTGSLYIRKDNAGRETWYGQWRVDGRLVKRKLGTKGPPPRGLNRRQAEARLRDLMGTVTLADLQPVVPVTRPGERSLRMLLDAYLADKGDHLKAATRTDYERAAENWLLPFVEGTPIARITSDDVEQLIAQMRAGRLRKHAHEGEGLRPKSIRNYVTLLSQLLNYAVRRGWLERNVAAGVTLPANPEAQGAEELRFLEVHEVNDLAASARPGSYRLLDRALYLMAAMSGLRQGELLALRWESVDLIGGRVRVVRGLSRGQESTPKSRRSRSVPLAPAVVDVLTELGDESRWSEASDTVFACPSTGRPLARTPLMERYRDALEAAALDRAFRFHDLRHTFGTLCARAGEPATTIQAWMGHSDLKTTERYLHYAPAHDEAARIARAFAVADPRSARLERRDAVHSFAGGVPSRRRS